MTVLWNLALYDADMLFVANDHNRFSIGSTTDGLTPGPDGSLTLHIQHTEPTTPIGVANWLPAPTGAFTLTMRLYGPETAVLDRSYRLPAVTIRD